MRKTVLITLISISFTCFGQVLSIHQGGGEILTEPTIDNCLNDFDRASIQERLQTNRDRLIADGRLIISEDREDIIFDWPLRMSEEHTWNSYYGISNYVDQNPADGDILDFNCGDRTYDGHKGIDIFSWPFPWYQYEYDLIEIIAAAEGVIIEKDDGFEDNHCECIGPWNAVYVQHSDGSVAWYGHMKTGSLTDKDIGETVAKGEYLGIVASSGCSTGPHLHLEVYDSEINLIEPFSGDCNIYNEASWWADQEDYRVPTMNTLHTHDQEPEHGCPNINEDPHFQNDFYPGDLVYTAFYYRDALAASTANYKIKNPDGVTWQSWDQTMPFTSTISWWYWTWYLPEDGPYGVWTLEATFAGETLIHEFNYGVYAGLDNEEKVVDIEVYPNPANSSLFIKGTTDIIKSEIFDAQGKLIQTESTNNQLIDVSHLPQGYYTIRIQTNSTTSTKKFIKN